MTTLWDVTFGGKGKSMEPWKPLTPPLPTDQTIEFQLSLDDMPWNDVDVETEQVEEKVKPKRKKAKSVVVKEEKVKKPTRKRTKVVDKKSVQPAKKRRRVKKEITKVEVVEMDPSTQEDSVYDLYTDIMKKALQLHRHVDGELMKRGMATIQEALSEAVCNIKM